MEAFGFVVGVIERKYWLVVEIYCEGGEKWFRYVPKRFDINFGDYISMDTEISGDALWGQAVKDDDVTGKMIGALLPFLEIDNKGNLFENGKMVSNIKTKNKKYGTPDDLYMEDFEW